MQPSPATPDAPDAPAPGPGLQAARAALVVLAGGVLAFGARGAWGQAQDGHALVPLATLAGTLGLAALLAAAGLAPARVARLARAPGLVRPAGLLAFVLVSFTLFFIYGVGALVDTAGTLEQLSAGQGLGSVQGVTRSGILLSLSVNFVLFTVPVLLWAAWAERRPGRGAFRWTLGEGRVPASVLWGLLSVLLVFWFLLAAGLATRALGGGDVPNERAQAIGSALDVPSALLVAALTGIGEEVFFRGFLLKKLGNGPQAVLFGLAHLNYVQALEVGITAALGYLFGRTAQRTGSIVGPIVGHAAFNAISLLLILYKGSAGFPAGLALLALRPF